MGRSIEEVAMRRAFLLEDIDRRFQRGSKSAKAGGLIKVRPMAPLSELKADKLGTANGEAGKKLHLADFFWRPWYAKLWWTSALIFWVLAAVVSWAFPGVGRSLPENAVNFLTLALHPFIIVPVLGFTFAWAWRQSVVLPWDPGYEADPTEEDLDEDPYGAGRIGFHHDPMSYLSDPTDVRSPLNPVNPANPWWRHRH